MKGHNFGNKPYQKCGKIPTDTEEGRKNFFKQFGFSTLIIWDRELKHPEKVVEKIRNFMGDLN